MKKILLFVIVALILYLGWSYYSRPTPGFAVNKAEQQVKGAELFTARCALCHGKLGLGEGALALAIKDYPSTNLTLSMQHTSKEQIREVILQGGSEGKMHRYSPPWKNELSEEEISLLIDFVTLIRSDTERAVNLLKVVKISADPSIRLGKTTFNNRCVLCHGVSGEGNGKMAVIIKDPPPFNLTRSVATDKYLQEIISKGGAEMGRSFRMPPWKDELTDVELQSVILYIKSLRKG